MRDIFSDAKGLEAIADGDPRNAYILRSGRGGESHKNPLPMLIHRPHGKYFLKISEDGLVVAAASVYSYEKGSDPGYRDADTLKLSQVGVHAAYRNRGLAKDLLNSVFRLAAKTGAVLRLSGFEPDGRRYLEPIIPDLHAKYPEVKVLYDGEFEPINGKTRYKLERGSPQPL